MKKITATFSTALKHNIINLEGEFFRCLSMHNVGDGALHLQAEPILCDLVVNRCYLNYMKEINCVFQKLFDHDEKI